MDYPLENLGPERFQQLCQALLVHEFPHIQCFPVAQPDGGRDAVSFYSEDANGKFIVFQVKYARKPLTEADPHKWLAAVVEGEAPKVKELIPRGASRYFLITNIPGTGHLDAGAIDKVNKSLGRILGIPSVCWWRDDISRRLDKTWDLKWTYPEIMTGPDFLRAIIESGLSEHRERRSASLRAFLRSQYDMDEEVRFKQIELQNKLLDLFIDVPIAFRDQHAERNQQHLFRQVIAGRNSRREIEGDDIEVDEGVFVVETGVRWYAGREEHVGAATLLLSGSMQKAMPHVVVEGAPGQGKSTIAQYICQVHRMRLLQEVDALKLVSPEHARSPVRLPIKVDLRDVATWIGKRDPFNADQSIVPTNWNRSLESFLAALISHQAGGASFTIDDLLAVLQISSVLIVFDGLDEVADMSRRREVVEEIVKGVRRLEENAASLQAVVTSRPAAFANSPGMPHRKYPHLQLLSLNRPLIMEYAERWRRARRLDSKQTAEFGAVLKDKLDQPHLRDLARNPMQLAILLSLIHTRGASLPDKRTALYDYYIDLFFNREAAKSSVVRDHRELLVDIHRHLAWLLQSEAEQGNSHASVPQDRLQRLVSEYLDREGHDPNLANELFAGMVERVVALVSRVEGTFEFEVQPLREYFAACHLYYTAPQSSPGKESSGSKPDRFDAICRNFYWLNVTRFFAGCYSKGELPSLVERLQELAGEDGFRTISYPRTLAATLLSDWVFTQNPRSVQQVVELVLDAKSLRYILAPYATRRHRATTQSALVLPPKCGREELVRRCFEMLETDPPKDVSLQLLEVLKTNSESKSDISGTWMIHIRKAAPESRRRWVDYGLILGVLSTLELETLHGLVADLGLESDLPVLGMLFRAGRLDYISRSEQLFDNVICAILDRRIIAQPHRRIESALYALSHSVDASRYAFSFRDRQPVSLADLGEARNGVAKLTWSDQLVTNTESYNSHPRCVELLKIAEQESRRSTAEWATDIAPWDRLIEAGRLLWGERWAFVYLANVAAGVRSNTEKCSECPDLLDDTRSLARRVRYARLRSGGHRWWWKQFDASRSVLQKTFTCLIALTWAKISTLLANQEILNANLVGLTQAEWEDVFYSARRCTFLARVNAERKEPLELTQLSGSLDHRFFSVLIEKVDAETAHRIYTKYLKHSPLADPIIREFTHREALDVERFGTEEWRPELAVVRRCYELGESFEPRALSSYSRNIEINRMALPIAQEIASQPDRFPSFLVAAAEERCRQEVSSKVTPVAVIASRENWFSTAAKGAASS